MTRTIIPGIERQLGDPNAQALTQGDFELIMEGAPIRKRMDDGTCWLLHPSGTSWMSAAFKKGKRAGDGYISFAVSYSHIQFLKVWADAFELALRCARHLGARVFEDSRHQEINPGNAAQLLDPQGKFVSEQAKFWKETIAGLDSRMQAPLEFPVGDYDAVNDYMVFFLEPKKQFSLPDLTKRLGLSVDPESVAEDRFATQDEQTGSLLSRVLLRPNDGALQIWPFYWMEPFSNVGPETLRLADTLRSELGGRLYLREKPVTAEFKKALEENINGFGVEFFLWLSAKKS